ncbi:MAG TPA: hypothetical protein VGN57_21135 [Pirellulaceae bacterium]|jgi:plastocyanin|nr:hypothetical protein [Pirellulaceae bacterium]
MRSATWSVAACSLVLSLSWASFGVTHVQAQEQKWGDLEGSFELIGQAPAPKAIVVPPAGGCGAFNLLDESLVIGRRNGIANIVVTLQPAAGVAPPIHPQAAAAAAQPSVFNNAQCRFDPRIGVVSVGQTLNIGNVDQVGHNVNAALFTDQPFNVLVPTNGLVQKQFSAAERLPMPVTCNIHPWMQGYLVIAATPYVAVTSDRGSFKIENLPVGNWRFRVWHERAGFVDDVTIANKKVAWPKGVVDVNVQPGKNELGRVGIDVNQF